jgi:hypothetical protein
MNKNYIIYGTVFFVFLVLFIPLAYAHTSIDTFSDNIINSSLWTDGHSSYSAVTETSPYLALYVNYRTGQNAWFTLNGAYAQSHYEIKNNSVNMTFEMSIELNNQNCLQIIVGSTVLYQRCNAWDNGNGYKKYNLTFWKNNNTIQLFREGVSTGKMNAGTNDNFLKFYGGSSGTSGSPNQLYVKNLMYSAGSVGGGSDPCAYSGTGNFVLSQSCTFTTPINIQSGYYMIVNTGWAIFNSGGFLT